MIRSLVISQQQMGTREIVVLHHTDCGAQTFTNEGFARQLRDSLGVEVGDRDFLPLQTWRQVSEKIWLFCVSLL
ncbi:beta-carbonic anhydrase 1 (plasmid) [Streptococcus dysgalactiae]|nr:beta-carbonic anhydrase 1 [Streptococcus dysgalactiae]